MTGPQSDFIEAGVVISLSFLYAERAARSAFQPTATRARAMQRTANSLRQTTGPGDAPGLRIGVVVAAKPHRRPAAAADLERARSMPIHCKKDAGFGSCLGLGFCSVFFVLPVLC